MKKLLKATACAVAMLIGCASARAADIWSTPNACGDGCTAIFLTGEIKPNDWKTFADIVKNEHITKATVMMASPGGEVTSALRMGLLIRANGFATVVPEKMACASGCALMWLAGTPRMATTESHIGFHAPYIRKVRNGKAFGPAYPDSAGVSMVKKYMDKLGVSKPAQSFLVSASADDMYWLNEDLATGFGIDFVTLEPTQKQEPKQAQAKVEPKPEPKDTSRVVPAMPSMPPVLAKADPLDDPLFESPAEVERQPRRVERPRPAQRQHRRVVSRGGGRTCGIGIPYIGITLRIRC
jgi:hypothetical protein